MIGLRLVSVSRYFFCPGVQGLDDPVCSFAFCVVGTIGVYPVLIRSLFVSQTLVGSRSFWYWSVSRFWDWSQIWYRYRFLVLVLADHRRFDRYQGWNWCPLLTSPIFGTG